MSTESKRLEELDEFIGKGIEMLRWDNIGEDVAADEVSIPELELSFCHLRAIEQLKFLKQEVEEALYYSDYADATYHSIASKARSILYVMGYFDYQQLQQK